MEGVCGVAEEFGIDEPAGDEGGVDAEGFTFHPEGVHDRMGSRFRGGVCTEPRKWAVETMRYMVAVRRQSQ